MANLKEAIRTAPCLRSIDYPNGGPVKLSVDTSYHAIGWYISQQDTEDPKKWYYCRFGSTLMSKTEANYSQPKRELFGLMRALQENRYWLIGLRKLIVETDAKYIKGMLANPEMGPNATINRWIENVLAFHFELQHVPGKTFAADGLSRRPRAPDDPEQEPYDHAGEARDGLQGYLKPNPDDPDPLDFEDFKCDIDTRGGYALEVCQPDHKSRMSHLFEEEQALDITKTQLITVEMLPDKNDPEEIGRLREYEDGRCSPFAREFDAKLPKILEWLKGPLKVPKGMDSKEATKWVRDCSHFFEVDGKLWRRQAGHPQRVVPREERMYIMKAAHDDLGHRGAWATHQTVAKCFWWPDLEADVHWYMKTCHLCQVRTKMLIKTPPPVTETPSIFQVLHADVLHMTPASNGCKYVVHRRCALSSWMEGKALKEETGTQIGTWLFDIITRWGCMQEIVTDNGGAFEKATLWLEKKYGIKGIKISAYNSKANGRIERPHYDVRDMLYKATSGKTSQWYWYFQQIMWADRVTVCKRFGVSPFFMITGAEPVLPLDIQEATWLVEPPLGLMTTEDLIASRARALAKHRELVENMRKRVSEEKRKRVAQYEKDHEATIRDYQFKRGDLVLLRNTAIEKSLDKKMKARYLGPLVVVSRNKGGAYILAELDGAVLQSPAAAFRVIPYFARKSITLPKNIETFVDIQKETLESMINEDDEGIKEDFVFKGMPAN